MAVQLADVHKRMKEYIDLSQRDELCPAAEVSKFWADIFKARPNFPDVNEMRNFRRGNCVYGIGGHIDSTVEEEKQRFAGLVELVKQYVAKDFMLSIKEPSFGAPYIFEYDGVRASPAFVMYSGIAWRCKFFAQKFLSGRAGLYICDIGAGFGGAAFQLHNVLDVNSFTIVDLPENLFLSGAYLQMTLPEKTAFLAGSESKTLTIKKPADGSLYFVLPQHLKSIDFKFDLIINTYSLHEMDKPAVNFYIDWINEHLSEGGIFISINSHGKAGIKKASEYGFGRFDILSIGPAWKTPAQYFNKIPYEVVVSRKKSHIEYKDIYLDALCELMQLGLNSNISGLCLDYASNSLSLGDRIFLEKTADFFYKRSPKAKAGIIKQLKLSGKHSAIVSYLEGNLLFSMGKYKKAHEALALSCSKGLRDFARVKARITGCVILNVTRNNNSALYKQYLSEAEILSPSLSGEIKNIMKKAGIHKCHIQEKINIAVPLHRKIQSIYENRFKHK